MWIGAVEHGYASSLPPSLELESHMGSNSSNGGLVSFRHRSNSSLSASSSGSSGSSSGSTGLGGMAAPLNLKRLNSHPGQQLSSSVPTGSSGAMMAGATTRKSHPSGNRSVNWYIKQKKYLELVIMCAMAETWVGAGIEPSEPVLSSLSLFFPPSSPIPIPYQRHLLLLLHYHESHATPSFSSFLFLAAPLLPSLWLDSRTSGRSVGRAA